MAVQVANIRKGACYSNGEFGKKWCVWQVAEVRIEMNDAEPPLEQDLSTSGFWSVKTDENIIR